MAVTTDIQQSLTNLHAVILAGGTDFGRCRLTSRLPAAFWPVIEKPALVQVIEELFRQGVNRFTVYFTGQADRVNEVLNQCEGNRQITVQTESMPLGTGGCLREAAKQNPAENYLLCQANMTAIMPMAEVYPDYQNFPGDLTVLVNGPDSIHQTNRKVVAGFLCGPEVIHKIPSEGYCDIKEALVPQLTRTNSIVRALRLNHSVGPYRDWPGYLRAIPAAMSRFLQKFDLPDQLPSAQRVWTSPRAHVAQSARLVGPVIVLDYADIADNAVIIGPTVISQGARVGSGTLVDSSVLWKGAQIGPQSTIQRCLLDCGAKIPDNSNFQDRFLD